MGETLLLLGLAQATAISGLPSWRRCSRSPSWRSRILPEERHLEARFGQEYLDYKARTRRWF